MARSFAPSQESDHPTVLIVDDDCDVRDGLKELLIDAGYLPVCARHGDEALSYLRRNPAPAAILLDLFMPVMNGWEFVKRVRATTLASIPIIAITGAEPHWGVPVPNVVRKPLHPEALLGALRQVHASSPAASA
jgi:CheY-like chemotaxis protein